VNHTAAIAIAAAIGAFGSAASGALSIDEAVDRLVGAYIGDEYALYIAEVESPPLHRPLYVEVVRRGDELRPTRQQVWELTESPNGLTIRVNEFPTIVDVPLATDLAGLATGMWAAPDLFPLLRPEQFDAVADLAVRENGDTVVIAAESRFPSNRDGAHTESIDVTIGAGIAEFRNVGVGRDGAEAWSLDLSFGERQPLPRAKRLPSGVVLIDLRVGTEGPVATPGDMVAADIIMQRTDGFVFHSSVDAPEVLASKLDAAALLPGVFECLKGMRAPQSPKQFGPNVGGIRKALVPAAQAFGQRGNPPFVGPNQSLNLIVVLESVLDKTPDEPAPN